MVIVWWLAMVAQAAQVLLQVDPQALVEGQSGRARVIVVENSASRSTLRVARVPVLAAGDGLSVGFEGQSSEFRVINGQISQFLSFTYRVTAIDAGEWTLGPVDVQLQDGSRVATSEVKVQVSPRSTSPDERAEVVVEAGFDVERAYEGQVVLYDFRFESTNLEARADWQFPDFEGLRHPQEGQPEQRSYLVEDPEGSIVVSEGALPLIATGTGTRTHPPAIAQVQTPIGPQRRLLFRRVRTDPWATKPAELTVVPLPKAPPGFSGLVGDFMVKSNVDRTEAVVGQSVGWTLRIGGTGALEGFALPTYEASGGTVYDNDTNVVARIQEGKYLSAATFRRVLVPTQAGVWAPPVLELVTFSPSEARFVTHEIRIPPITVRPGREGAGEVTSFAIETDSNVVVDTVDMAPRDILTRGRANAWRLTGWLPFALGLTALPGLLLWLRELATVGREQWDRWTHVPEVERTAAEIISDLPRETAARQAAYETAMRLAMADQPDDEELEILFQDFLRARFGDGAVPRDLEVRIERAIRQRAKP